MATYHLTLKVGAKGKAAPHFNYICAIEKYAAKRGVVHIEHGNMPIWAMAEPALFWKASDEFERANGTAYRELEISLPRELPLDQQIDLAKQLAEEACGNNHAFSFAIHNTKASDGGMNPHVHLQFSERIDDGIERDPKHYFKRADKKQPEKGGCLKDRSWQSETRGRQKYGAESSARLLDIRQVWEVVCNQALETNGIDARIDCRSHADRGLQQKPQPKVGAKSWHLYQRTGEKNERFKRWKQVVESNNAIIIKDVRKPSLQEKHSNAMHDLQIVQRKLAALQSVQQPDRKKILVSLVEGQKNVKRLEHEIWQLEHITKHKAHYKMKQSEWKMDAGSNWFMRGINWLYYSGDYNTYKEKYEDVLQLKSDKSHERENLTHRLYRHPYAIHQTSTEYERQLDAYQFYHQRKTKLEQDVKSAECQVSLYESLLPTQPLDHLQHDSSLHLSLTK